jgi:hypothetical protein
VYLGVILNRLEGDVYVVQGRSDFVDALLDRRRCSNLAYQGHFHLCLSGFGTVSVAQRTVYIACE